MRRLFPLLFVGVMLALVLSPEDAQADASPRVREMTWDQVDAKQSFTLALERREYTALDLGGRFVLAVQAGAGQSPKAMKSRWSIRNQTAPLLSGEASLSQGLAVVDFDLSTLSQGAYTVEAELLDSDKSVLKKSSSFSVLPSTKVPKSGRVPLLLPRGVTSGAGAIPLSFGVPMPSGIGTASPPRQPRQALSRCLSGPTPARPPQASTALNSPSTARTPCLGKPATPTTFRRS